MNLVHKIAKVVTGPDPLKRTILAINKSPLRFLVRRCVNLFHMKQRGLRVRHAQGLKTDARLEERVHAVRDRGYTMLDQELDSKLGTELLEYTWAKVQKSPLLGRDQEGQPKDFWVRLSDDDLKESSLSSNHVLVRYALQESILKIVASYFGEVPCLTYVLLTLSQHTDEPLKISQLWHSDRDDVKILKLFTYLSDVTDVESGPLTLFDRPTSRRINLGFFMRHTPDESVRRQAGGAAQVQIKGPKMTSFVVDTGVCHHMGSRMAPGHMRLMFTALYTSFPSMYPGSKTLQVSLDGPLTPLQRMVLQTPGAV